MIGPALLLMAAAPAASADEAEIRRLRAASNAAIAAHDLAGVLASFAPGAATVRGSGGLLPDRAAIRETWRRLFATDGFGGYSRTPERVDVGRPVSGTVRAAEAGRWEGRQRDGRGEARSHGRYLAQWQRTPAGWRVVADLYVTLGCDGPAC